MENVEIPEDIILFTKNLIDSGDPEHCVIRMHAFQTEEEEHDDELIVSIIREFTSTLKQLESKLSKEYGLCKFTDDTGVFSDEEDDQDEDDDYDDEDEEFYVPCSFVSAIWSMENCFLYLAICQEDREYPITLAVGVEYE